MVYTVNTLRPRQNGRHFPDDIFKCIFLNENVWISLKISMKFVPKGEIDHIPSLVQIMAWRRPGDKPLSEAMMVSLLTHVCVTRPQWVKISLGIGPQTVSLLAFCDWNPPVTRGFPHKGPAVRIIRVCFAVNMDNGLNKQSSGQQLETS